MKKSKTTRIFVRGFDSDFHVDLKRDEFLTIDEAEKYIRKDITDTAYVKGVTHFTEQGEVFINNDNYEVPNIIEQLMKHRTKNNGKETNQEET